MKTIQNTLGISLFILMFLCSGQVQGQRKNNNNRGVKTERVRTNDGVRSDRTYHNDRYRTQPVRRNPHYRYPHHRRVVRTLPRNHVRIVFRGLPYFYYSGIYYTLHGSEYIVVMPPRGFRITVLPVGYTRIVIGSSVYFYHSGVYYTESTTTSEDEGNYEVTQPPTGVVVNEIHEDSKEILIDGNLLYEYNDIFYKKVINEDNTISYKVVYSKS